MFSRLNEISKDELPGFLKRSRYADAPRQASKSRMMTDQSAGRRRFISIPAAEVRLQTDDPKKPRYRGTTHCFVTILEKESAHGLYKGMSSPLAGVSVVNAVAFGTYGAVIRNLETDNSMSSILFNHGVAGAAGGLVQTPLASTLELAKTRMQLQSQGQGWSHFLGPGAYLGGRWHRSKIPLPYSGPIDCMRRIWRKEGTRGIFRGLGITIVRDVPGFAYYFASYEMFCKLLSSTPGEMLPHWKLLVAGGLSGMVSWIGTYPLDVVKSRIQADGATGPRKYSGYVDCVRQSLREEGLRVFGRGLTSTLIRAFIVNAATFAVVTWVLRFVGNMADNWEFPLPYNQLPDQHHPFIPLTRNQFPSPSSVILDSRSIPTNRVIVIIGIALFNVSLTT
ncbi:unnamed protein product [Darwinula stevensoni]|uniref:Mitochondrial basic amino acids transporter n=1 Tax=Darwinula stevensoni TaxID=69355 RepID=A0A7R8ZYU5_9CRUS|nr:unnamed protein product [Darwinula stevensoni]CAG0881257.1 unnamed protein product [Darwinula stevensoni]